MLYKHTKLVPVDNVGIKKAQIIQVYKGTLGTIFGCVNTSILISILQKSGQVEKKRRLRDKQLVVGVIATTRYPVVRKSGICVRFFKNKFMTAMDLDSYQGIYIKKPFAKELKKNLKLEKMLLLCKQSKFY